MKLPTDFAGTIDWAKAPVSTRKGDPGVATAHTRQVGDIQLRVVTYTPGYVSDHWCPKGHIMFVLDGAAIIELKNGKKYSLEKGMSYYTGDDDGAPHRLITKSGASIFIVDSVAAD
jgi:hypothetical protein